MEKRPRGRPSIAPELKKPQQTTLKVNDAIVPLVRLLKSNLKKGLLSDSIISDLMRVANNKKLPFKQTTALNDEDLAEQAGLIERLTTQNATLSAQVKQLEKQIAQGLQKLSTPVNNSEKWVLKYDTEHQKLVELEGKLRNAKHEPTQLKAEISRLTHLEHDCQCLKANGDRCSRPAKVKANWHGIEINVCNQHQKTLKNQH